MNSNLPVKQDNTLCGKIKNFFRKLFFKEPENTEVQNNIQEQETVIESEDRKDKFQESIKVEVKNDYVNEVKREEFLDELESNPQLLYDLPIEKLEKLENYYEESIKKQEIKLAKMKKAS